MNCLKPCKTLCEECACVFLTKVTIVFILSRVHDQKKLGTLAIERWGQIGKGRAKGTLGTAWVLLRPIIP